MIVLESNGVCLYLLTDDLVNLTGRETGSEGRWSVISDDCYADMIGMILDDVGQRARTFIMSNTARNAHIL